MQIKQVTIMHQTTQNIPPKYYKEMQYNYVKNSGFVVLAGDVCSPLLHYHYVITSLTMQIPAETLSQTHRVCFMLLCYRFVTTALTAQIPAETLSQSHRLCFMLLHYHCENHANSCGNAIANSLGFSLFSAFVLSQSLPHKFLRKGLIKILVRENLTTS